MFSEGEFDVAAKGRGFPAIKVSTLRSLEQAFQLCEEKGFFRKSLGNANEHDQSVRIHPLMTLVLRSQPFALPEWAAHAMQVAFHRLVSYQTRHWSMHPSLLTDPEAKSELDAIFPNYATACKFSLGMEADFFNCVTFDILHWSVFYVERRAPVVLDLCDRFLEVFGLPLALHRPSVAQKLFSFAFKTIQKIARLGGNDYVANERGLLEMRCLRAIHDADMMAELLDVQHNDSELLEGIARNLQTRSDCYEVNVKLLAAARTRLARHTIGDQDRSSAMKEIFNADYAVAELYGNTLGSQAGMIGYDMAGKIAAVEAPEEIDSLEQELRNTLERQLDGINGEERKAVIYESLAVLDLKRERYEDAFRHIDTATEIFRPFRQNKPQAWESLVDERDKVLAMKTANADRHARDANPVPGSSDDPIRSITTTLQHLQDAGAIGSYRVTRHNNRGNEEGKRT
ncbi:MAG: hypothetical protein Q9191_008272 [Dirinaria sp. TL-2023a]